MLEFALENEWRKKTHVVDDPSEGICEKDGENSTAGLSHLSEAIRGVLTTQSIARSLL